MLISTSGTRRRVAVIGAGMGGLAAAVDLAIAGVEVSVFERAAKPGGKIRQVETGGKQLDAGPSVFTMREIFDDLFAAAGEHFDANVKLIRADVLARHAWKDGARLDLHADVGQSSSAIADLAGAREARGFEAFAADAGKIYATLRQSFIRAQRPSPFQLLRRLPRRRWSDLTGIQPFTTLWRSLGRYFKDPRLRQLFGRYATYCGSSPFASPATLMLVAHVEQTGVWYVEGGLYQLAAQLAACAQRHGATLHYDSEVTHVLLTGGRVSAVQLADGEYVEVDAVVCNADTNALAKGHFGEEARGAVRETRRRKRSLSAMTWNMVAKTRGFPLAHHTVLFGGDYRAEFESIFERNEVPSDPTIYLCAQDRRDAETPPAAASDGERLFCLLNAPATGDMHSYEREEIDRCEATLMRQLTEFGLLIERSSEDSVRTTPTDFDRFFPATGGALYGPASHGWTASFTRPGSRSRIPGLYLAGGSVHPGPGVPMAATSGRLAAASLIEDFASMKM